MLKLQIFTLWCVFTLFAYADSSVKKEIYANPDKAAPNYFSYFGGKSKLTPAPKGYKPFYISHYGRHGSRYLGSNEAYHNLIPLFEKAQKEDNLTTLGKKVLQKLKIAYADAHTKGGKLSKLGGLQHEQIAHRMITRFPEVFENEAFVDAYSTSVDRCIKSMNHACEELLRVNPKLRVSKQYGKEFSYFMACKNDSVPRGKTNDKVRGYNTRWSDSIRHKLDVSPKLFKDTSFVSRNKKRSYRIAGDLYSIKQDMQCLPELKIKFDGIFTKEQEYNQWKVGNLRWGSGNGIFPGTTPNYKKMRGLIQNIFSWVHEVYQQNSHGATLRFGHDAYLCPLYFTLGLGGRHNITDPNPENLENYFQAHKVVPMGGNIQLIFYRKEDSKDILVKFLLQEEEQRIPISTDIWPYYHLSDVEKYYKELLKY